MEWVSGVAESIGSFFTGGVAGEMDIFSYFTFVIRLVLPLLAIIILSRCASSLLRGKNEPETWAYLSLPNGSRLPLNHWENVIGRSKSSDVILNYPTISRSHAALIRDDNGIWTVMNLGSKGKIAINGRATEDPTVLKPGDVLEMGGVSMVLIALTLQEELNQAESRTRPGKTIRPSATLVFLTQFQALLGLQLCISKGDALTSAVPITFIALAALMWLYFFVFRGIRRTGFEVETIAFFLSTIGMAVTATSAPGEMYKQLLCLVLGMALFIALGFFLRDLNRAKKIRWPATITGLGLLGLTLIFGTIQYGAQNWIYMFGFSVQPSEFVKIAFVLAGAATLDRLFARRNLLLFIAFAAACVGALALMGDFGTALIFFVAFLVIAFLRSGDLATIALSISGAVFAGLLAIRFKPYIAERFASWGHAWDYVNSSGGYQQTRTMMSVASGGLFGLGAGNGWLKNVGAADTDLVFGLVSEELGLIIAALMVVSVLILTAFVICSGDTARSSFYVIAAGAAVGIFLFQIILNVFGSVDLLPLTGVTFPFVSNGGSSLIASWGLLSFIKAADTRQNASFAIKLPSQKGGAAQ